MLRLAQACGAFSFHRCAHRQSPAVTTWTSLTTPLGGREFMSSRQSVVSITTHRLSKLVVDGWVIGDRLPTERQLAQNLGVSRCSIREAINQLAANGILKRRHGVGTIIAGDISILGRSTPGQATQSQILEARLALEPDIASLASQRASREHIADMAAALFKMFAALDDIDAFRVHDLDFHRILGLACGNPILGSIMAGWGCRLSPYVCHGAPVEAVKSLAESHRKLYRAVRSGNSAMARKLTEGLTSASPAQPADEESIRIRSSRDNGPKIISNAGPGSHVGASGYATSR